MRKSSRSDVEPFIVMDVMEQAREAELSGKSIIHMEVGQPGTGISKNATKTVMDNMSKSPMGYTVALGLPQLRKKISDLYQKWYGIELDPNRVIITSGSSGAFLLAFSSLFDSGDRVGIGSPGYPSYKQILKALGLTAVTIQTKRADKFQPTPYGLAEQDLDGLLIASPANPTGTMLNRDELSALIEFCSEKSAAFISDEIYHGIEYDKKSVSALEITNECYVINSFSKYFCMTGWRVGWIVVPETHVRRIERLAQNLFICAPHISQIAALASLENMSDASEHLKIYQRNRVLMIEGLGKAGFKKIAPPDGAFYIYADISDFSIDSLSFCKDILEKAGVAITPGLDFDAARGNKTVRFSYARTTKEIEEGLFRIQKYMQLQGQLK